MTLSEKKWLPIKYYDFVRREVTYKKEWDLAYKSGSEQVDVSQLSPGMYFLYYEGDRESGIRKIQIE